MEKVTISAALRRIAALKGDIARLSNRRPGVIVYREDSPPAWSFDQIESDIAAARKELIDLKVKLAVANATAKVTVPGEGERTIIDCITEMQEVKGRISEYEMLEHIAKAQSSFSIKERDYEAEKLVQVEVAMKCDLTSQALDEKVKALRERFALLNAVVEAANHTVTV